ncbi:unnamed protein product [Dicrocoelium dendriticum]|nr:unnamed protein product [Dicrocoelium dendriticum]
MRRNSSLLCTNNAQSSANNIRMVVSRTRVLASERCKFSNPRVLQCSRRTPLSQALKAHDVMAESKTQSGFTP